MQVTVINGRLARRVATNAGHSLLSYSSRFYFERRLQMRKSILVCLAVGLFCAGAATSWSQATNSGTLVGVVTDRSNAVVSGATVTLRDISTGGTQTATTNEA